MKRNILILIFIVITAGVFAQDQYIILVSFDGFRWDYCKNVSTPTFDSIEKNGVKAESLQPSFPTKTFPNHYTLVTGLYPDNNGIINNTFYSPEHNAVYSISDRGKVQDGTFYLGIPIWNLAEEQGVKTASFYWVGSEANINNRQPSYWKKYEHNFPFEQRIDTVIKWLQMPEKDRPHLILLYFHEPDSKGHDFGPDSKEIEETVEELDNLLKKLFIKLNQTNIKEKVNVIVVSDHGMGSISKTKRVFINDFIKTKWVTRIIGANPVFNIWAKGEYSDSIKSGLQNMEHIQFWENNHAPQRFHYGSNSRTGTFTVVADSSWSIYQKRGIIDQGKGTHGYDNQNKDMHGIFYAIGPAFKKNEKMGMIENMDIYPLIAHILKLKYSGIDGQFERIKDVLKE